MQTSRAIISSSFVGTTYTSTFESSEEISKLLLEAGLQHEMLNAKNHAREAEIIKDAGSTSIYINIYETTSAFRKIIYLFSGFFICGKII